MYVVCTEWSCPPDDLQILRKLQKGKQGYVRTYQNPCRKSRCAILTSDPTDANDKNDQDIENDDDDMCVTVNCKSTYRS